MDYPSSANAYRFGIQDESVIIYVRNYAKRAIMIKTEKWLKTNHLKEKIYKKMRVPVQEQALFLQGNLVSNQYINLENKMIFHLINMQRVRTQKLSLAFKKISYNSQIEKFYAPSTMLIDDFISAKLQNFLHNVNEYFLVYAGRELNTAKTFQQQFVEDCSQILCIHKVENLKVQMRRIPKLQVKENFTGKSVHYLNGQNIQNQSNRIQDHTQRKISKLEKLKLNANYGDILTKRFVKDAENMQNKDSDQIEKNKIIQKKEQEKEQDVPEKVYEISLYDVLTENYQGSPSKSKYFISNQNYSAPQTKKQKDVQKLEIKYFLEENGPEKNTSQEEESRGKISRQKTQRSSEIMHIFHQRLEQFQKNKHQIKRSRSKIIQVNIHHTISIELDAPEPEDLNIQKKSEEEIESKQFIQIQNEDKEKLEDKQEKSLELQNQNEKDDIEGISMKNANEENFQHLLCPEQAPSLQKQKTTLSGEFYKIMNQRLLSQQPSPVFFSENNNVSDEIIDFLSRSRSNSDKMQRIMSHRISSLSCSSEDVQQAEPAKHKTNKSIQVQQIMNSRAIITPETQNQFSEIIKNELLIRVVKCHSVVSENGTKHIIEVSDSNKQSLLPELPQQMNDIRKLSIFSQRDDSSIKSQPKLPEKANGPKSAQNEEIDNEEVKKEIQEVNKKQF